MVDKLKTRRGTGPFGESRIGIWSWCGAYRYSLEIDNPNQTNGRTLFFVGMNPSTANEKDNDNTVFGMYKRMLGMNFARMHVLNAYAIIQTDSRKLGTYADPKGEMNDAVIYGSLQRIPPFDAVVLVGWGNPVHNTGRGAEVYKLIKAAFHSPFCLGKNQSGAPRHPLYVPRSKALEVYSI